MALTQYDQFAQPVVDPTVVTPQVQAPALRPVQAPPVVEPTVAAPTNSRQAANAFNAATQDQASAVTAMGRAQAQDAADAADLLSRQNAMEAGLAEQEDERLRQKQERVDQLAAEHRDLAEQASRVQIADRRSSGQKVLGILGVALAGLGDALSTKQTDYARRVSDGIDQAVERDLQLQREALNGKRADVASKFTEVGIARQAFGDEKMADEWARAKRKEMWASRLEEVGARSKSALVQAASAEKVAALRASAAETQEKIFQQREQAGAQLGIQREQLKQRADEFAIAQSVEVEKARLAAGAKTGEAKPLTDGQRKQDAVVAGAVDSYARLKSAVAGSGVNAGASAGALFGSSNWVPNFFTGEKTLQERADITNLVRSQMRVESGSNVPDSEVEGKIKALGLDSGDDAVRARGMQQLLTGFQALDVTGRLQQSTPAAQEQTTANALTYLTNPLTGETKGFPANMAAKARSVGWKDR